MSETWVGLVIGCSAHAIALLLVSGHYRRERHRARLLRQLNDLDWWCRSRRRSTPGLFRRGGLCRVASGSKSVVTARPASSCRTTLALQVLGALDFGANALTHHVTSSSIQGGAVIEFLEQIALQGDERPTVVVLDNASIHHAIEPEVHERWLREHRMQLFYLPPYSPELNLIEIVWKQAKYHWRNFVTWTKETIDDEVRNLLGAYGTKFQINFA